MVARAVRRLMTVVRKVTVISRESLIYSSSFAIRSSVGVGKIGGRDDNVAGEKRVGRAGRMVGADSGLGR